jgi:Tfp pilus assembly protein PilN
LTSLKESSGKVVISGMSVNEEMVAVFMHNLEASSQFANVVLKEISLVTSDGAKSHKFELNCSLENQPNLDLDALSGAGAKDAKGAKAKPAPAPAGEKK